VTDPIALPPEGARFTVPPGAEGEVAGWDGSTGPLVLPEATLAAMCRRLLGLNWSEVDAAARVELVPHPPVDGEPSLILHSATSQKRMFEGHLDAIAAGRHAADAAAYIETRSVYLAAAGDLVVGRTEPWREAAALAPVESVEVPAIDYYYLTHALLTLADASRPHTSPTLGRLAAWLRSHPRSVVRVYALDRETQVLLLWLKRAAGLDRLRVEANGPDIAARWNHKAPLHPTVDVALSLGMVDGLAPAELLVEESTLNPFWQRLGLLVPRLPGYTIEAAGGDRVVAADRLAAAAMLLRERYGLRFGCHKPARGGAGARIKPGVPLDDPDALARLAAEATQTGEDYVLEAHADYLRHRVRGHEFILAPSAHVRDGRLADGATLQITDGTVWKGNVYIDESSCGRFGLDAEQYRLVRRSVGELLRAFGGLGGGCELVKGGIDFAVARVGGRFGDSVLVGMQDLNLSSCGAEFLRVFLAQARLALGRNDPAAMPPVHAATKVVRPAPGAGLALLREAVDHTSTDHHARAISSVPGRWGLVAVAHPDPVDAAEQVLALEERLRQDGLLARPAGAALSDSPFRSSTRLRRPSLVDRPL